MAKKKSNAGRPTVMTDQVMAKLEEAFAVGATDIQACFYAGISKDSLYEYQTKNPGYSDRKAALKNNLGLRSKMVVGKSITEKHNVTDAKWYLEKKHGDEFNTTTKSAVLAEHTLSDEDKEILKNMKVET